MNRAELETTARIKLDELQRLLASMTPAQQQAVTERPARRRAFRPFPQVAALLPACDAIRAPRVARRPPPAQKRATTQSRSLAVAERKAPRTVAELRAKLDCGETPAMWAASCELSPQILAHLTAEELALIPPGFFGSPSEGPADTAPPPIEVMPAPVEVVAIPYAHDATTEAEAWQRVAAIGASLAFWVLFALCAVNVAF